jgi:hypothetical protein
MSDIAQIVLFLAVLIGLLMFVRRRNRSATGWASSIGDVSAKIGYDVRELYRAGYTDQDIQGIVRGDYTVQELLQRKPSGGPR